MTDSTFNMPDESFQMKDTRRQIPDNKYQIHGLRCDQCIDEKVIYPGKVKSKEHIDLVHNKLEERLKESDIENINDSC